MAEVKRFSIKEAEKLFSGPWDPQDIVEHARHVIRVARFEGKYGETKHTHLYDELFLVLEGQIEIDTDRGRIELGTFDGTVIPAGIGHQPIAEKPALVLMIDPKEER